GIAIQAVPVGGGRHAVYYRGLGALLGTAAVRHEISADGRGSGGCTFLEDAPLRAHYFLAELPHGQDDPGRVHRAVGGSCGTREGKRGGRSAAVIRRRVRSAVPGGVSAGRRTALRAAQGTGRWRQDDQQAVP